MNEAHGITKIILGAIGAGSNATLRMLIGFLIYLLFALTAHAEAPSVQAFPAANPQDSGIPAKALELLSERVQSLVDNEEIVGGELVVIKNRRTVFREAFGWKDRESEQKLEVNSVYCVRSMTKPFVGTAIQRCGSCLVRRRGRRCLSSRGTARCFGRTAWSGSPESASSAFRPSTATFAMSTGCGFHSVRRKNMPHS